MAVAARITAAGGPEVLSLIQPKNLSAKEGEVSINQKLIGVNSWIGSADAGSVHPDVTAEIAAVVDHRNVLGQLMSRAFSSARAMMSAKEFSEVCNSRDIITSYLVIETRSR